MADNSSSSVVAIFAIVMMILVGAVLAWRFGVFGGDGKDVDINVTPSGPSK
jgi:hypothetical protein